MSDSYTQLTEVPIAEYQEAVSEMLEQGVADLGLANNTVMESETTISGSLAAMKAAADNFLVALVDDNTDVGESFQTLTSSVGSFLDNVIPKIWDFIGALGPIGPLLAGITAALVAFHVAVSISKIVVAAAAALDAYRKANEGATVAQWLLNAAMNANPIVLIVTLIAGLVSALIVLWNTNEEFREKVTTIWEDIKKVFVDAWESITQKWEEAVEFFDGLWEGIKEVFAPVGEFFEGVGKDIVDFLKKGISNKWGGLITWFNKLWGDLFGNREVDVKINKTATTTKGTRQSFNEVDGSHASGLWSVPWDNYIARLHQGEMVVPRREAEMLRNGNGNNTIAEPITIIVQSILDGRIIGETAYKYNLQTRRAYGV